MRTDQLTGILENLFGELMHGVSGKGGFMLNAPRPRAVAIAGAGDGVRGVGADAHRLLDRRARGTRRPMACR